MPEYAVAGAVAVLVVIALERFRWRSGVFGNRSYWIAMAICLFFMVLVNGWLTKLSAPIVRYDAGAKTPWRFPWDIPVEDYLFGFALLTAVLARWEVVGRDERRRADNPSVAHPVDVEPAHPVESADAVEPADHAAVGPDPAPAPRPEGVAPCPDRSPSLSPSSPSS